MFKIETNKKHCANNKRTINIINIGLDEIDNTFVQCTKSNSSKRQKSVK